MHQFQHRSKKKSTKRFWKTFFSSWWIMQFLKKSMENVRKGRDIELLRTERRWTCLVSEPNYHTEKFFTENILAIEIKKKQRYVWINLSI